MSLYKIGETYYVYIVHNGRRIRRSTGSTDRQEAQRYHDELKAGLWQQKHKGHTLNDALKLWLKQSPRSRNEKNAIALLLSLYPNRPISEITGTDILDALADKGPAHANRIASIARAALNLAKGRLVETVPKIPKRKVPPSRIRWLTYDEWDRLDKQLPEHLQAMARFAISTGLRKSNVVNLKWRDVDVKRKLAWVHPDEAKAGKAISAPLSDMALAAIQSQIGKHPVYVFSYNGRQIVEFKTAWGSALKRAGIEDFRWHDLRHTWASWHVQNGTPLAVLKELGGWADMSMVMRYSHLSPDHVKGWAGNFGPHFTPQTDLKPFVEAKSAR